MIEQRFDLIIIGAGPGGYVAAIRGAQLGMKVAVVEKRGELGGVCLNEGCIPSKALLHSSELFSLAGDSFKKHGILIDPPALDLSVMLKRKDDLVKKLTDGVDYLFKKNEIERFSGIARLLGMQDGEHRVCVELNNSALIDSLPNENSELILKAHKVILATGSEAASLSGISYDRQTVVNARDALTFKHVPEHLVVAGAGSIGLELGSVWMRLGSRVTVMEMLPRILPALDHQVAEMLYRSLRKQGMKFKLATRITAVRRIGAKAIVQYNDGTGSQEIDCDKLLVAVGRKPDISGVDTDGLNIRVLENGRIYVDDDYQTTCNGIYAIGDLIPGPMLAHKASEEGVVCVERMNGKHSVVEYQYIPAVCYTSPEAASVGRTEEQVKDASIPYRVGRFSFSANGRANAIDKTEGFVKIVADAETDRILGVHVVGAEASEIIAEAVAAMSFGATARDIALICHPHPTMSEALREAAMDVHKEAIHA